MVMTRMRSTAIIRLFCWQMRRWSPRTLNRLLMMATGRRQMAQQMKNWHRFIGFTIKTCWKVRIKDFVLICTKHRFDISGINLSCPKVQSPSEGNQRSAGVRSSTTSAQSESADESGVSEDNNAVVNSSNEHVSLPSNIFFERLESESAFSFTERQRNITIVTETN